MKRHLLYLRYLARHKWFVFTAGLRTGAPLWRLLVHDLSKLRPSEWRPYVRWFYGAPGIGSYVEGVADGAPFQGVVMATRPGQGGPDYFVELAPGCGKPFWAWHGEVDRKAEKDAFNRAWLLHQRRNPHHWQFWVLVNDEPGPRTRTLLVGDHDHVIQKARRVVGDEEALPMPDAYVREMVADWAGAGRAITGRWDVASWWEKNREHIVLHRDTRARVEQLVEQHFVVERRRLALGC